MNIQTQSVSLRKPTKNRMKTILEALFTDAERSTSDGHLLAEIYRGMFPKYPGTAKNDLQWVSRAAGTKEVRPHLHYARSDGENLVAIDLYRMHMVPTEVPPGHYDKNGIKIKNHDWTFPDYKSLLPNSKTASLSAPLLKVSDLELCGHERLYAYLPFAGKGEIKVDYISLLEALDGARSFKACCVDGGFSGSSPVLIAYANRTAVLQPIRDMEK